MPQADGSVANGNGAQVRAEINSNLTALFTSNSGGSTPQPNLRGQTWYNTGINPNRFEIKNNSSFVPLRDADGRVILPTLGYNRNADADRADPAIYFDGSPGTGFFEFEDNVVGFTTSGDIHYVLGRSVGDPTNASGERLNQQNAFIIGPASYNPAKKVPSLAAVPKEAGFCVSDTGECHIGTDGRPLTLNTFDYEKTAGLINFNTDGDFKASISWDKGTKKMSYGGQSDYRLKTNVLPIKGAKALVNKLKPYEYNISNASAKSHGFIAHEVQEVLPNGYAYGKKDETYADGSPKYQQIDYSSFTPLLTAALKEAFAEIAALTERVQELEAKANG